jgi:hypothetical protein
MGTPCAMTAELAKEATAKAGLSTPRCGATHVVIVRTIKEIFYTDTVKVVANWLGLTWKTARNRMDCAREFSLDEVADIIVSDHGFRVVTALMNEAKRTKHNWQAPDWWLLCEPLMELAEIERMAELARRRTQKVIRKTEDHHDALEQQLRFAQTLAIQGSGPARTQAAALRSYAGADRRVVATGKGR